MDKSIKYSIILSSPNSRGIARYATYLHETLVPSKLIRPTSPSAFWLLWEFFVVPFWILYRQPSCVILVNSRLSPLYFLVSPFVRTRIVTVIHDFIDFLDPFNRKSLGSSAYRLPRYIYHTLLTKIAINFSDRIITNSRSTTRQLLQLYPARIPIVSELKPSLSFDNDSISRSLASLDCSTHKIYNPFILAIAGTTPNKALSRYFLFLVANHALLTEKCNQVIIVGCSEDDLTPSQLRLFTSLSPSLDIRLYRRVSQDLLLQYQSTASLFLSLSASEGYGIPVADSLAFNCPTILSAIPPYTDQIHNSSASLPPHLILSNQENFLIDYSSDIVHQFLDLHFTCLAPSDIHNRLSRYSTALLSQHHSLCCELDSLSS